MSWPLISIEDAPLFIADGNYSAKYPKAKEFTEDGIYFISGKNIINGAIDVSDCKYIPEELHATLKKGHVKTGDVLLTTRGNIGNTAIVPERLDDANINAQLVLLRPDQKVLSPKYLKLIFQSSEVKTQIESGLTGSALKQLPIRSLKKLKIPLPPLPEQQKIAAILDAADQLRQKDQQLIEHYTRLGQALFLEMFGDPVTNPMGWKNTKLENIADIASGVTKGRKLKTEDVFEIPYMRVANVQAGYLNLDEVKTVPGTTADIAKFALQKGDVLLTEGGDPDKLGRGTVWNNEIENCIHQNHIFRVRLTYGKSTPLYLSWLCGSDYGKRYFLKSGKQTTGIASINKTQLRRFPVLQPPVELQNQFAQHIEAIDQQKQSAQASLEKSESLFNSLLQRAFKGELTG